MPELNNNRGLLAKNADIRKEMLRREQVSTNDFFSIEGKEEYQDTFTKNNKLEDNASLMYANLVSLNAYINKDRFLGQKYITPKLIEFYGSNPQIDGNIGYYNIFNAHNGTYHKESGRIVDDYNEGVRFIELSKESDLAVLEEENGGIYYYTQSLKKAEKENNTKDKPSRRFVYDWKTQYPHSEDEINDENSLEDNAFTPQIKEEEYGKIDVGTEREKIINEIYRYSTWEDEETGESGRIHKSLLSTTNRLFANNLLRNTENTNTKILKSKSGERYLRNWRKYKQYNDSVKNLAGNYKEDAESGDKLYRISDIQRDYKDFRAKNDFTHLGLKSVLDKTGFVNIVRRKDKSEFKDSYKKCMFSIENLAWKDVPQVKSYLSSEQRGPNGGRIMWFPPYDISFDESINVNWNDNTFIGRGEKVYTYTNTERTGTLSFTLLIDHPNVLNHIKRDETADDDILRFFAGEQLLKVGKQEAAIYEAQQPPVLNTSSISKDLPKGKKQIKFSIYFPQNYSGMYLYNDEPIKDFADFLRHSNEMIDRDWWVYLLIGSDTYFNKWDEDGEGWDGRPVDVGEWRGYQISTSGLNINETAVTDCNPVKDNKILKPWVSVYDIKNKEEILTNKCYGTRVDYDFIASLSDDKYYYDTGGTLMLNGQVIAEGSIDKNDSNGTDFSFSEAITAIANFKNKEKYAKLAEYVSEVGGSPERINEIIYYLENLDIEEISIKGSASYSEGGESQKNAMLLSSRRSVIVKDFLKNFLIDKGVTESMIKRTQTQTSCEDEDPYSEEQIRARRVDVTISFKASDITKLSDTANGATSDNPDSSATDSGVVITDNPGYEPDDTKDTPDGEVTPSGETTSTEEEARRYENEAEYFKRIVETDRITYEKITEKIKYFNPAFHSISPEGFNARLTFLQQCMRQGHTIEASDKNGFSTAAGNLAFGRMPVCVLTLGDFICSRIIIISASIQYSDDGMQWDLNKTGAGVQPMFAKVSLQIVLLGGQSLGGPISRLQNAVSFNYYANTGVYDDRADRRNESSDNGYDGEIEGRPWAPYPNEGVKK